MTIHQPPTLVFPTPGPRRQNENVTPVYPTPRPNNPDPSTEDYERDAFVSLLLHCCKIYGYHPESTG